MDQTPFFILSCCLWAVALLVFAGLGVLWFNQHRESLAQIRRLESQRNILTSDALRAMRERWFVEAARAQYISELDVEIKVIYPLVRFLGYDVSQIKTRVSIGIQVGRQKMTGIADWVIYKAETGKPFFVIEAKEQGQPLSGDEQGQARSYAYALSAPYYLVTNGRRFQVYERGVENDTLRLAFEVSQIAEHWDGLQKILGRNSGPPVGPG